MGPVKIGRKNNAGLSCTLSDMPSAGFPSALATSIFVTVSLKKNTHLKKKTKQKTLIVISHVSLVIISTIIIISSSIVVIVII